VSGRGVLARCALGLLLAALAAGCGRHEEGSTAGRKGPRLPRVVVEPVATRAIRYEVNATGALEARQIVTVPTRVAGVVEDIAFDVGTKVGPQDVLLVVDRARHKLAVLGAKASLDRASAALDRIRAQQASAQASLDEARANLARRQALREKLAGAVTDEELEAARTQVLRLEAGLEEALATQVEQEAIVRQAQADHDIALEDQANAEVHAPIVGVVQARHVSAGQYVRPGDAIATLVDVSVLRLRFRVGERESVRIRQTDPVTFTVAAVPHRSFDAKIVHIAAAADPETRMVEVLADVEEPPPELKPGFFAEVSIRVGGNDAAVVVPERAIRATEVGYVAFVLDGKVVRQHVLQLGLHTSDGLIEVVEGLKTGDDVVVEGAAPLEDGMQVELLEAKTPAEPGGPR